MDYNVKERYFRYLDLKIQKSLGLHPWKPWYVYCANLLTYLLIICGALYGMGLIFERDDCIKACAPDRCYSVIPFRCQKPVDVYIYTPDKVEK